MKPKDNSSNLKNANRGTNRQYDQAQGNCAKQLSTTPNDANGGRKRRGA